MIMHLQYDDDDCVIESPRTASYYLLPVWYYVVLYTMYIVKRAILSSFRRFEKWRREQKYAVQKLELFLYLRTTAVHYVRVRGSFSEQTILK